MFGVVVVCEDLPAVEVGIFGVYHKSHARASVGFGGGHGGAAAFLLAGIFCHADALGESIGAVSEADGEAVGFERGGGAVRIDSYCCERSDREQVAACSELVWKEKIK